MVKHRVIKKPLRVILKNKPLIEAIFELRWELKEIPPGLKIDPHYKLLIGRLYDRMNKDYPYYEELATATMPDGLAEHVVQHRFRKSKDGWPLVQLGPGIITLNDTDSYVWEDFGRRIGQTVRSLFQAYPDSSDNLKVNRIMLRYIDAVDYDFGKDYIFDFLRNKLKTELVLSSNLFRDTGVSESPLALDMRFAFSSTKPKGVIRLRFVRGQRKNIDALIWETMVESSPDDAFKNQSDISNWIKKAHELTDDWFFKLIEGDLQRRFE